MTRRGWLRGGAAFFAAVLLLCLARTFVQARFDGYLRASTEANYQSGLEQLAYKLDSAISNILQLLERIAENANVRAIVPEEFDYQQQQRISDATALLRISAGYGEYFDSICVYMPGRVLTSLGMNYQSLLLQSGPPLSREQQDALAQLGQARFFHSVSAPLEGIRGTGQKNAMLFCRAFSLDGGEDALALVEMRPDWLSRLFGEALVRVTAPDGKVLHDGLVSAPEACMRAECADGWVLEWDARATDGEHLVRGTVINGVFVASLLLVLALTILFLRHKSSVAPSAYFTLAIALPVMLYVTTHFALLQGVVSQAVYSSCRMAYDNVLNNLEMTFSRAENTILRIMFDSTVYSYKNIDDTESRLKAIRTHLTAANTGMYLRVYDGKGEFLFQTHSYGIPAARDTAFDPKMINTLLRGHPSLERALGGQYYLEYTIKLYDIADMDRTGFFRAGIPETELSRVFIGGGANFVADIFVMGPDGTILSCVDTRRIGQKAELGAESFVSGIGNTSLLLVAVPDAQKIQNDLYALSISSIIYILIVLLIILLCMHILLASRLSAEAIRRAELESIRRRLEIQTLQAQISPHFLCNTIETIRCLMDEHCGDTASYMLKQLSNMFKFGISRVDNAITVEEELNYARAYIRLMNIRFDGRIHDEWHVDGNLMGETTLKLILQPVIENSIHHTLGSVQYLNLSITLATAGETMYFEIVDDGAGISPEILDRIRGDIKRGEVRDHVGLANVARRIRLFYGEPYGLEIHSQVGQGTTVRILLPRKRESK